MPILITKGTAEKAYWLMKYPICLFTLFIIVIFISSCDSSSEIKTGLSYEEYIKEAQQYESKGDNEKGISAYKKALTIKPNEAKIRTALGRLYDTESQSSYREAFSKYSLDILTNTNKKRNKDQAKELEEYGFKSKYHALALLEYSEAIKLSPDQWDARYYIATDHYNNKRYQDAINEYNMVIRDNPKYKAAYILLSNCYLEVGTYNKALENINKAYQLDSDAEYYYYQLGTLYYKLNSYDKGFEMQTKLKNMNSKYYGDLLNYKYSDKKHR
jgi:tetratricopeptide (TPR) repeat protein